MVKNQLNQSSSIDLLKANRLLRSSDEVALFEQTLEKLAEISDLSDFPGLHLTLDDTGEQPEIMFSLVHFLESFDVQKQVSAFIEVMPELVKRAPEWAAALHSRIMNDEVAQAVFEERMRSLNAQEKLSMHQVP